LSGHTPGSRILLVRHGRSSLVQTDWLDADGFRRWREAYEATGIVETDRPPASLMEIAERADLIVSSDAPRAVDSARLLARGREITGSSLVRELALEGPRSGSVRLPLRAWALSVGVKMLAMKLRGGYPSRDDAARVNEAARWLDDLAARHSTIVVVTHASFRRQLANSLVTRGWRSEERPSARHWSVWPLSR
jgi:broad specificity phosphatase PhoE